MRRQERSGATIRDLRGGVNLTDHPLALPDNQVAAAVNIEWRGDALMGRRRNGSTTFAVAASAGGSIGSLVRHIPATTETESELWLATSASASNLYQNDNGSWTARAVKSNMASSSFEFVGASFNGKLFFCYNNAAGTRAQVWDGTSIRYVGLGTPAAPTAANAGVGTFTGTRYYKVAYTVQSGGSTVRRSELSTALTFAPSGTGASVTVTKPASISEGETHWEVYASTDNSLFYLVATTVVGTTTYSDTATSYSGTLEPVAGTNTVPVSARYVQVDEARVLWASDWAGTYGSRVWFSAILGSTGIGDDERIPQTITQSNYIDLDPKFGGDLTGMAAPMNGVTYCFKTSQIHKIIRTGNVTKPYVSSLVTNSVGCLYHRTICWGVDEYGHPALYFLDRTGPYRITNSRGLQFLGTDIEGQWDLVEVDAVGFAATPIAHGVFYPKKKQVWWWVTLTGGSAPTVLIVFDIRNAWTDQQGRTRGGWSIYDGEMASALCSVAFSEDTDGTAIRLKPWTGNTSTRLLKCDVDDVTTDNNSTFKAYLTTRQIQVAPAHATANVTGLELLSSADGVEIEIGVLGDWGKVVRQETVTPYLPPADPSSDLTVATKGYTRVDVELPEVKTIQLTIGDKEATSASWALDTLDIVVEDRIGR